MQHTVLIQPYAKRVSVPSNTRLTEVLNVAGLSTTLDTSCGCISKCGKCRVLVEPESSVDPPTPEETEAKLLSSVGKRIPGERLACCCKVAGDMVVTLHNMLSSPQCATKLCTNFNDSTWKNGRIPSVVGINLTLSEPKLDEQLRLGDLERVLLALEPEYGKLSCPNSCTLLRSGFQSLLRSCNWLVTAVVKPRTNSLICVLGGHNAPLYGTAVDIGTTTIAFHLCDLRSGQVLFSTGATNPQISHGQDVMSRVAYASSSSINLADLRDLVLRAITSMASEALSHCCAQVGSVIVDSVFVGNTTMEYLFLGVDPVEIGRSPFSLPMHGFIESSAAEIGLTLPFHQSSYVRWLPAIAAHVGADTTGALLASGVWKQDACSSNASALLDIGTNCEIVVSLGSQYVYAASSPTGPAFEGAQISCGMRATEGAIERVRIARDTLTVQYKLVGDELWYCSNNEQTPLLTVQPSAVGICGSGIIEAVAEMAAAGIIEPNGRFSKQIKSPRVLTIDRAAAFVLAWPWETKTGRGVTVTARDVRAIQLGKAALFAGVYVLLETAGVKKLDTVYLAGAFGSYIDKERASAIGLFPHVDKEHVHIIGNAAGDGAVEALLDERARILTEQSTVKVRYVELAGNPRFQELFVNSMSFL